MENKQLTVIGGGLAGTEAAWQAAQQGIQVDLYEMRPVQSTRAHVTDQLAELVCSNSLGSNLPDRASGVLKTEMRALGSLILDCAEETAVPAGGALAVDREGFAELVTARIGGHPNITVHRQEMTALPDGPTVIASGPLTSKSLTDDIQAKLTGENLFFYDAISPIVYADSINMDIAFRASRYQRGEEVQGDYINCPLNKEEYYAFVDALIAAERIDLREFEQDIESGIHSNIHNYFESCLPIEIIASRGVDSLAFGPMRPVGLIDPRSDRRPYAVVQLRQDNLAGSLYNLVGFQTNLRWPEQKRVFELIPGLETAEYARFGMMHRNTFVNSPSLLEPTMQTRKREDWFFAGQITGIEGYIGNAASGLIAGLNAGRLLNDQPLVTLPQHTMLGTLCHYITHSDPETFQPMKANFGIIPPLDVAPPPGKKKIGKRDRYRMYAERSANALTEYMSANSLETMVTALSAT